MIPPWVLAAAGSLLLATLRLLQAKSDRDREEALMTAAEAIKAAQDEAKFGGG